MPDRPTASELDQREWVTVKVALPREVAANLSQALWVAKAMGCGSQVEAYDMLAAEFLGSTLPAFYEQADALKDGYDAVRFEVLCRDGWRCIRCGTHKRLHVHHIKPRSHFGKKRIDEQNAPANLQTLCADCHARHHSHAV